MARDEFIEAHRAECRLYISILQEIDRTWRGDRIGTGNHRDRPAELAARLQTERHGPTLGERMKAGTLVVLGFNK